MIGHIKPPLCRLPAHIKNDYKNLYCSICYSLRQQFGLVSSAFVNNELTLTVLAFSQNINAQSERIACPARLFCTQKSVIKHHIIDSAAQFSLLLAWVKITDWATDSPAFYKTALKKIFDKKVMPVLSILRNETQEVIDNYIKLTKNQTANFDEVRKMSALLAKQIAKDIAEKTNEQTNYLETRLKIVEFIGEMIAIADPLLDLKADIKNQTFNPIVTFAQKNNTDIQTEYEKLKQEYHAIENKINQYIQLLSHEDRYQVFTMTLTESLSRLSQKIEYTAAMSSTGNNQKDEKKERSLCRYCDCCNCCDCFDLFNLGRISSCSNCFNENQCCGSAGADGCCDCCGNCDCSC